MREAIVKLASGSQYQFEIGMLDVGDALSLEPDFDKDGAYLAIGPNGDIVGRFTASSWVAQALEAGQAVHHCSVNSIGESERGLHVNARVAVGETSESHEVPPPRSYPVGLAGEAQFQAHLRESREGSTASAGASGGGCGCN